MAQYRDAARHSAVRGRAAWLLLALLVAAAAAATGGLLLYLQIGRTPGELMDYAEHRMAGHPRVEALARPGIAVLRAAFDAPSVDERARMPFVVPPPSPRRGAGDVAAPDPVPPGTKFWRVSKDGPITQISEAARLARPGDVVEIEAGDYYGDVALWEQSKLTIRGIGGAARLFANGRSAEGKAIWVIRHGNFDIANIDFIGTTVEDGNGAGIRFEGGHLRLRSCLFWGNQMGLLTGNFETAQDATIAIEGSEFGYSHVDGRWGHNLYVGSIDSLTVRGSYFHHAGVGHLLKSRARVSEILYNRLTDETGGRASYEMDFPNGGAVRLVGNVVQQQIATENSILISYGSEGYKWPLNVLYMASNTLVNDLPYGGTFLRVAPGADRVVATNNLRVGPGRYQVPNRLTVFNDVDAEWRDFARASRQDYRLRAPSARMDYKPLPDEGIGLPLTPDAQYVHPLGVESMSGIPLYVGADQRTVDAHTSPANN
jgi:hypothetical protein